MIVAVIVLAVGGYWIVQMLRKGSFVAEPNSVATIVSSKPSPGERKVRVNAPISVRIAQGHSIDPATLEGNVRLFRSGDQKPVDARISSVSSSNEIVLTPLAILEPETSYSLEIRDVKDVNGTDLVPYVMTFTTDSIHTEFVPVPPTTKRPNP